MRTCPDCKTQVEDRAIFCDNCGCPLESPGTASSGGTAAPPAAEAGPRAVSQAPVSIGGAAPGTCAACGFANIPGEMFCQRCGVQLPPVTVMPPPPPVAVSSSVPQPPALWPATSPAEAQAAHNEAQPAPAPVNCSVCGTYNPAGETYCQNCGMQLSQPPPGAPQPEEAGPGPLPPAAPLPPPPQTPPAVSEYDPTVLSAPVRLPDAPKTDWQLAACPTCGWTAQPNDEFCPHCGYHLAAHLVSSPAPEPEAGAPAGPAAPPAAPPPPEPVQPPAPPADSVACPACGSLPLPGELFCAACGFQLAASPPPVPAEAIIPPPAVPPPAPPPAAVVQPAGEAAPPAAPAGAALSCPTCHTANLPNSRFCQNCGQPFGSPVSPPQPDRPPVIPYPGEGAAAAAPAVSSGMTGRFVLQGFNVSLPIPSGRTAILFGRAAPEDNLFPEIDLTHYGAAAAGVSRSHARLTLQGSQLYVEDLNSVNGTFLNKQKLQPGQHYPLKHGDELRIARIVLEYQAF